MRPGGIVPSSAFEVEALAKAEKRFWQVSSAYKLKLES